MVLVLLAAARAVTLWRVPGRDGKGRRQPKQKTCSCPLGAAHPRFPGRAGAGFKRKATKPAPYVGGQVQAQSQRLFGRFI